MGRPRLRAPAAVDLRRKHLPSQPQLAGVLRKSDRQRDLRRAGAVAHRKSRARREHRVAAVVRAVRARRVRARPPGRVEPGRGRADRPRLRVLTAALFPFQPASSHGGPVDSVRAGLASRVSGARTATRSAPGERVFHAPGADQRTRWHLCGGRDPSHARVSTRARRTRCSCPPAARLRHRGRAAAGTGGPLRDSVSRRAGRRRTPARARSGGDTTPELSGITHACGCIPAVTHHGQEHQRRGDRVAIPRVPAGSLGTGGGCCRHHPLVGWAFTRSNPAKAGSHWDSFVGSAFRRTNSHGCISDRRALVGFSRHSATTPGRRRRADGAVLRQRYGRVDRLPED